MMLDDFGVTEDDWRDGRRRRPGFARVGVAALRRPGRRRAGRRPRPGPVEPALDVARPSWPAEYGFTDVDGSQPDVWAFDAAGEAGEDPDPAAYR